MKTGLIERLVVRRGPFAAPRNTWRPKWYWTKGTTLALIIGRWACSCLNCWRERPRSRDRIPWRPTTSFWRVSTPSNFRATLRAMPRRSSRNSAGKKLPAPFPSWPKQIYYYYRCYYCCCLMDLIGMDLQGQSGGTSGLPERRNSRYSKTQVKSFLFSSFIYFRHQF